MIINAPLFIYTGKLKLKKNVLNLNIYRNQHHQLESKVKKEYTEMMIEQLLGLKLKTPIKLVYTLFRGDRRKGDRNNPLTIHDKYFCDALTSYKCIPDDTDEYIESQTFKTGEIDKENPRVEIKIIECKKH